MRVHRVEFSGAILERGFWLYAWRIRCGGEVAFYVGRTGDSSSKFAASPFARLGQHLDVRPKATVNMLLRHVRKLGFEPLNCKYELVAFGPLFPEQSTLELHRAHRDRIAPLEAALAQLMRERGFSVVGSHGAKGTAEPALLKEVKNAFNAEFGAGAG
jgi:hypothetical protein